VHGLLPASFAFAAGAMLTLVVFELVPQAFGPERRLRAGLGSAAGAAAMIALASIAGV
jgi:zinc transporter ZupT